MGALEEVLRRLEDYILEQAGVFGCGQFDFEYEGRSHRGYPYIRSSMAALAKALLQYQEMTVPSQAPPRFLEVGCGLGSKCELARQLGFEATGVDLKPEYCDVG